MVLSTAILAMGLFGSQQQRRTPAPQLGSVAPPVVAAILGEEKSFDMAANLGKRATVLIFGSCT